ncbi:MAG: hypothetical protein ACKVIQ_14670, partial [Acidimicrobiales bacterium]
MAKRAFNLDRIDLV